MDNLVKITRNITFSDLKLGKISPIDVYDEQMKSWIFQPLQLLASEKSTFENAYAMFALQLLFFEPHGKYLSGNSTKGSNNTFTLGFKTFLKYLEKNNLIDSHTLKEINHSKFYQISRCGVFHDMTIKSGLLIDSLNYEKTKVFYYNTTVNKILVNPWNFFEALKEYFYNYIKALKTNNQTIVYKNFHLTFKTLFKY